MKFLKRWWFKLSAIYESNIDTLISTHNELNENVVDWSWSVVVSLLVLSCSLTVNQRSTTDATHPVLHLPSLTNIFRYFSWSPGWCNFTSIPYCSLAADLKIAVATQGRQHTIRHQPMPSLPTASPLLQVTQGMQHQVCRHSLDMQIQEQMLPSCRCQDSCSTRRCHTATHFEQC